MASIEIKPNAEELAKLLQIGAGNETAWLELRESIVQEFAKRHLKALVNSDPVKAVLKAAHEAVVREVQESIGKAGSDWHGATFTPSPKFKAALEQYVETTARPAVQKLADEIVAARMAKLVETSVQRAIDLMPIAIDKRIAKALDDEFQARMSRAMTAFREKA